MSPAPPDLVYPLKVAGACDELRYSLRSIHQNAQGLYGNVWVVTGGSVPDWLQGVRHIVAGDPRGKSQDVRAKLRAACDHPEVSQNFLIMCDDFFLVEEVDHWEPFHSGPTSTHVKRLRREGAGLRWLRGVIDTAEWMEEQGYGDILARQGHRPLVWDKAKLAGALDAYPTDRQFDVNGLYDMAGAGGVGRRGMNSKVRLDHREFHSKIANRDIPWLSSNDQSFSEGMIGGYIRGMFPEPSPFEA